MKHENDYTTLKYLDKKSEIRNCDNSTNYSNCSKWNETTTEIDQKKLDSSTKVTNNSSIPSKEDFFDASKNNSNHLRRKRESNYNTANFSNTIMNSQLDSGIEVPVIADSSHVNSVMERAPLPYTNMKSSEFQLEAKNRSHNHRSKLKDSIGNHSTNRRKNMTRDNHPQQSKPRYVLAPVGSPLRKYKAIDRKHSPKFQESSPRQVLYSEEDDDSLFDYIDDTRKKNSNTYPYKFPDFNFPNLNHASFNFDDTEEESGGGKANDKINEKKEKDVPTIMDAHDSHDMEHEYIASEEGEPSEKKEKAQEPESNNSDEEEYDEENNNSDANEQEEVDGEEDNANREDEEKSEEEPEGEEYENESEEDEEGRHEEGRTNQYSNNNEHPANLVQGAESPWRPSSPPAYIPHLKPQLPNENKGSYDLPAVRYPYSSTDDIKQSFVAHPLAGPTATKGFNHDFTPLRGGGIKGPYGVEPPNKYPVVPLFNKDTLHKPLTTVTSTGPVSPINLSGFNGYKHYVAPLVSAEDPTAYEYHNPRQSGSKYKETYRDGGSNNLKDSKPHNEEGKEKEEDEGEEGEEVNEEVEDDKYPSGGDGNEYKNLNYPDFDDFVAPTKPFNFGHGNLTQGSVQHPIKPFHSFDKNRDNFQFTEFESKNPPLSNFQHQSHSNEVRPNHHPSLYNDDTAIKQSRYRKQKSTLNSRPKQTTSYNESKRPPRPNGNTEFNKPLYHRIPSGLTGDSSIPDNDKYDYRYKSVENSHAHQRDHLPQTDDFNGPIYPSKSTYEDYNFPKGSNDNDFSYPIKTNHNSHSEESENKFVNYPPYNKSSSENHSGRGEHVPSVDYKAESIPFNYSNSYFGGLTDKPSQHDVIKQSGHYNEYVMPSTVSSNHKDLFPNEEYKFPYSTMNYYHNTPDSLKHPSHSYYEKYNVPPYESIKNYRNKNLGDMSKIQSGNEYDTPNSSKEKYKNHNTRMPTTKNKSKSKNKMNSQNKKNKNPKMKAKEHHSNKPMKAVSNEYTDQGLLSEDQNINFDDTIYKPSVPQKMYDSGRSNSDFNDNNVIDRKKNHGFRESLNERGRKPNNLESIYDLHGLYHKNHKESNDDNQNNNNREFHNMKQKLLDKDNGRIISGGHRLLKNTQPKHRQYYRDPQTKLSTTKYSDDDELDEPSTEAPHVHPYEQIIHGNDKHHDMTKEKFNPQSLSKKELVETLNRILDKKDAISREQDIDENRDKPKKYSNHWVLEYSMPIE